MKNFVLFFFICGIQLSFLSCGSDNELTENPTFNSPPPASNTGTPVFSGDYDGNTLEATNIIGRKIGDILYIKGDVGGDSISLSATSTQVGTYTTADDGMNGFYYYTNNETYSSTFVPSPDGVINITKYDASNNIISGNFSGTMRDIAAINDISVTNGVFKNIKLTTEAAQDAGDMDAQIDGAPFTAYACVYRDTYLTAGQDVISGSNTGASQSITFQIKEPLSEKTYTMSKTNHTALYVSDLSSGADPSEDYYTSESGSLTITSIDQTNGTVEGTFNFTGTNTFLDSVVVDQGSFEAIF